MTSDRALEDGSPDSHRLRAVLGRARDRRTTGMSVVMTMRFKYGYTQHDSQQARTEKDTRRWRTLETEGEISVSCTFLHISLPDREPRRCSASPVENAVYARESSVFGRFGSLDEVAR